MQTRFNFPQVYYNGEPQTNTHDLLGDSEIDVAGMRSLLQYEGHSLLKEPVKNEDFVKDNLIN